MAKDYLAMRTVEPDDKVDHGVKGQRWGVTRTKAQLARAASSSDESDAAPKKTAGVETTQDRYNRLKSQAASKGPGTLSDDDLKFFNARTEALSKVAKLNEKNPNWMAETTKKIIQKTAQESLQNISSAVAQKYITDRVIESVGAKPPKKKKN